jgi:glucose 1-dehydrogenase
MTEQLSTSVEDKVIVVTGATAGIGRGVALELAARGAKVVGVGRRAELGESLAADGRVLAGVVSFVAADVTQPADCHRAIDYAVESHGRVDALINNAGGTGKPPIVDVCHITPSQWQEVFNLNANGTFFCSQRAIEHMRCQGGGVILNIASTQAVEAVAGMTAYNAAKAAVVQLGRSLAVECLPHRIRVNTVLMGGAATDASADVMREVLGIPAGSPLKVPALPRPLYAQRLSDIGAALALLCSDASKLVTGATIAIDRAMSAGSLFSAAINHAYGGGWQP